MRYFTALILGLVFLVSCDENIKKPLSVIPSTEASKNIKAVLFNQQSAWNRGDIDAFMEGYWNSEDLTFIGKSGVNRGWQTTLENYKKGYPDLDAMGKLSFEVIELDSLSNEVYRMIGRYTLKRKEDEPTGIFTLIWQLKKGQWLITSDQTCG